VVRKLAFVSWPHSRQKDREQPSPARHQPAASELVIFRQEEP